MQRMVERGLEGLGAVQREVAVVRSSGQEALARSSSDLRRRLEELHQAHHRHQDLLQVGGWLAG